MATADLSRRFDPELLEVVRPATFLFAAGQETVTKLLSAAVQTLGDRPEYFRISCATDRELIPAFIEEALRMQSPTKVDFRLARKTTTLGGVHIPAGTVVMLCLGAANRDPRKFENPHEFRLDRKNVREHIAFGRGIHTCAGAPLARVEGQITVHRLLDRMHDITIDETVTWPDRCSPLRLRAHLSAARTDRTTHRVHPHLGVTALVPRESSWYARLGVPEPAAVPPPAACIGYLDPRNLHRNLEWWLRQNQQRLRRRSGLMTELFAIPVW